MNDERKAQELARKAVEALDALGLALVNHNHQWTPGERRLYEDAIWAAERVTRGQRADEELMNIRDVMTGRTAC